MGISSFIKKRPQPDDEIGYGTDDGFYDPEYYHDAPQGGSTGKSFFEEEEEAAEPVSEDVKTAVPSGVSFAGSGNGTVSLKLITPKGFEDRFEIDDNIANGSSVILNIENLDRDTALRLMTFLAGALHILGGSSKKVTRTTFVFAPRNVGISGEEGTGAAE